MTSFVLHVIYNYCQFVTLMSFALPKDLDSLEFTGATFSEPYISGEFVWMLVACAFNGIVIIKAFNGWLISPKITKQVIIASTMGILWVFCAMIQIFVQHRALFLIANWTFYLMSLLIVLQHVELLKMFSILSAFWTDAKCRNLQIIIVASHFIIVVPEYIWPFGLERNSFIMEVSFLK